jgi:FKBP-type peptidyl-prolyl cis-trans isomerase
MESTSESEKSMEQNQPALLVGESFETSSGLKYKILEIGDGNSPVEQSQVKVHYRGRLEDGTEFDSSFKRGQPATFPVNGVIRGWTEALMLMKTGDKWELTIPPEMGYGSRAVGNVIPPNSTLIFEVELLEIL